jgi:hypothetical protein
MRNRALLGLIVALLATPRCGCDDDLNQLDPIIKITPELMDLGRRTVGTLNEAGFTVGNEGTGPLSVIEYTFEPLDEDVLAERDETFLDTSGAVFSLVEGPDRVGARSSEDATLGFTPTAQGFYGGTLVVRSDDLDNPRVRLPIIGEGGPPLIEAEPPAVDFGPVNEGPGASRIVRLVNTGFDTLHITDVLIDGAGTDGGAQANAFSLIDGQPTAADVAPGDALSVEVRMNPNEAAVQAAGSSIVTGTLVALSDAENEPRLEVPLSGDVNLAPRAIAVELITRRTEVKVGIGREVVIDGSDTEDPEGDDFTFDWSLAAQPTGSDAIILGGPLGPMCTDDGQCDTASGYRCITGSTTRCRQVAWTRVTPDAVGSYTVRLRATDARGAWREADAIILPRDFAVVLTWQTAPGADCFVPGTPACDDLAANEQLLQCCGQTDLDLHLLQPSGTLGDYGACPMGCTVTVTPDGGPPQIENRCVEETDTYVDSCRSTGSDASWCNRYPEWGVQGRDDDPRLDLDDVRGFGPEVITLNEPADGNYRAVVHYCSDRLQKEPTVATVEFYVEGVLVQTAGPQLISDEGEAWIAGTALRAGGPTDGSWTFSTPADQFDGAVDPDLCNRPECVAQ